MQELKKKVDYWQVVFTVTTAVGVWQALSKLFTDFFPLKVNAIILAAMLGALGALAGRFLYEIVKNKKMRFKIIAYVCELVLIFGAFALLARLSADDYIVQKEWKVVKNGRMSFEYPDDFFEFSDEKRLATLAELGMKIFNTKEEDRLAINGIFEFKTVPPLPEESLSEGILNALEKMNATDIEWFDSQFYEDAVESKVKYKIGKTERIGYGFLYNGGNRYEFCIFLPHTKNYSERFLERIKNSITIDTE